MRLPTLASLATDLAKGRTTSRAIVEDCLAAIADPAGEGARAFVSVDAERARVVADAMDRLRSVGAHPSPFAGVPISIKDLFDIAGQPTRAASKTLSDAPPAATDAPAVARLLSAGFVLIGRANMTEFAYSGLGLNPHFGTPRSPWEREVGRVPGGSSSGGGVSVADGMAHASLGSDTGGSCRIPAAFNGVVGYKPTTRRIPRDGAVPLSTTLDSVGPLARSVACCHAIDAVLAQAPAQALLPRPVAGLRLAVPRTIVFDGLDRDVSAAFESATKRLSHAGARLEDIKVPEFADVVAMGGKGGISAAEAYAWHRERIARNGDSYDPRIRTRILRGAEQDAADYIDLLTTRKRIIATAKARLAPFDAIILPTVAVAAPRLADLAADDDYVRINAHVLRNTNMINLLDGCALTIPIHEPGAAPVGLMIAGTADQDPAVFAIGAAIEAALAHADR